MREKLALVLMGKILDLIKESGANQREALSAIRAAEAMVPEMELDFAPTMEIQT